MATSKVQSKTARRDAQTIDRLRGYAVHHLQVVAARVVEIEEDLFELQVHPSRNPGAENRRDMLSGLLSEELEYLRRLINDILGCQWKGRKNGEGKWR